MGRSVTSLHPELQTKVAQFIAKAKTHGYNIIVSQAYRTQAEQEALYAQGRTRPGQIVTQARYPQSLHNWGVAFDIAVIINGAANWNTLHYKILGPIGESCGLEWGGRWTDFVDLPHFQLPGYTWSSLQNRYETPEHFISTWRKAPTVPGPIIWEDRAIQEAEEAKLIEKNKHKGTDPANKAFVAAMVLNLRKQLKKEGG